MEKELICAIPTTVAIVLGELLLASLITIIVMANDGYDSSNHAATSSSDSPNPRITFTQFTAITQDISIFKEVPKLPRKGEYQTEQVFSRYKWVTQLYYNDAVSNRIFSTENDGSVTVCMSVSSHNYCYRQTSGDQNSIDIAGPPKFTSVSCYSLFPKLKSWMPSRNLDKCDLYSTQYVNNYGLSNYDFSGDSTLDWLVESGTNYPVLQKYTDYHESTSTLKLYHSFEPGKPKDESNLKPLPDVPIVYDFRDGKGDVDGYTTYNVENERNNPSPFDNQMKALRKNKRMRELLHLPFFGVHPVNPSRIRSTAVRDDTPIPEEFDSRTYWSSCAKIIGTITDQAQCGSCWAMASAGVLSDRLCISEGIKRQLSPQYMVYCGMKSNGCQGGNTIPAWDDLIDYGTVSETCVPFTGRQGDCPTACKDYSPIDDSNLIRPTGYVFPWGNTNESRVEAIQREIMTNGPVMASFLAFDDFPGFFDLDPYGVYHRGKQASDGGGHAVRIIGWGTSDEGEDYWLVANSWGITFADLGVFRIRRGNNECNIEEEVGGLLF